MVKLLSSIVLLMILAMTTLAAEERVVFAGGCFWGVEAVFEHVKGVIDVRSGYAGGSKDTASYDAVSGGETKHAEVVEIRFDPTKISYDKLLYIFFAVAHDPTEVNRQGPDVGPQYRSAVFFTTANQQKATKAFISGVSAARAFDRPVATEIVELIEFFPAEDEHQDFVRKNPKHPYVVTHDVPKLADLKRKFPELYR